LALLHSFRVVYVVSKSPDAPMGVSPELHRLISGVSPCTSPAPSHAQPQRLERQTCCRTTQTAPPRRCKLSRRSTICRLC
jgi:hypothetical protein